jgi:integrase
MGMIYKRGSTWWIQYYSNGRKVRESTGIQSVGKDQQQAAKKFLRDREGRSELGAAMLPKVQKTTVDELLIDLRAHYETTGNRGLREAETRLMPLLKYFRGRRANVIAGDVLTSYIQRRQANGLANGTINRELGMLGTAYKLGLEHGKVMRRPVIHLLKEANPRQGFFEEHQFLAIRKHLPEDLALAVTIMWLYGWRRSEIMALQLSQIDLEAGTLRLEPGTTKNKDGRVVFMTPELKMMVLAQIERVRILSRRLGRVLPGLFHHLHGCYTGQPVQDFRKAWSHACERVGLVGMLRHDFRRSAVRNMERAGVPRSVAMKVSGHKTESIYRRYAIVNETDIQEATNRLLRHKTGTILSQAVDREHLSR